MKYFLHLSYKGKDYHGWQRQANVTTVQEVLETQLSQMLGEKIICHGCGRTDTGVNASQYFCNITIEKNIDFDFLFRINKLLPPTIVIYDLIPVSPKANAQYDAIRRTYDYFFHFDKNPFLHDTSTFSDLRELDFSLMEKAVVQLRSQKDFRAFCKTPDIYKHTLCEVFAVHLWVSSDHRKMRFQISANRFLRGMVRILAATLLEIGSGKMSLTEFTTCLETGNKPTFHNIAYPQGLYLSKVEYPFLSLPTKEHFQVFTDQFTEI